MTGPRWIFEISHPASGRHRRHPDRHWHGDYGSGSFAAPTEHEARDGLAPMLQPGCVVGDLIGLTVDRSSIWENRTGRPYSPIKRSAAALAALSRWRAGR